jgi:F0F1-type ATP synthase epsilon subunit
MPHGEVERTKPKTAYKSLMDNDLNEVRFRIEGGRFCKFYNNEPLAQNLNPGMMVLRRKFTSQAPASVSDGDALPVSANTIHIL